MRVPALSGYAEPRPQPPALAWWLRRVPAPLSPGHAPPGCHDNESAPRAQLLLGRDPGWTAGPGLGATAATAAFASSPSPSRPASPRLTRARGRGPSPPPLPVRMPKVKALQCALALEIRSVSTGDAPAPAAWVPVSPRSLHVQLREPRVTPNLLHSPGHP